MRRILAIGLLLSHFQAFSQYTKQEQSFIDSVKTIAEGNGHDSTRIKAYQQWDNLIYLSDPDLDFKIN